jgi:hypothetical protein
MPVFTAKHNELKLQEQGQSSESQKIDMLGTIKMPLNMKLLSGKLPESQYDTDKPKKEKKKGGRDSVLDEIEEVHDDYEVQ